MRGKLLANNKKARHDYAFEEIFDAGIVLTGTEIKSMRMGRLNLKDSFAKVENNEVFVYNLHISPYEKGNIYNQEPLRVRKLLLHKKEIQKMASYVSRDGLTLIPLNVYLSPSGLAKMEIAAAKGKKAYDKRETLAKRDADRKMRQEIKQKER